MPYTAIQLAEAFIRTGELTDALDALTQQLDATPGDDDARRLRAQVLARQHREADYRAALDDLNRIAAPSLDDGLWKGIILEQLDEFEAAAAVLDELHHDHPTHEPVAERLFSLLLRLRNYEQARRLLDAMPRTWDWLGRAGDLATEDGHPEDTPRYYSQALAHFDTQFDTESDLFARPMKAGLLCGRALAYATLNQFEAAEQDYAAAQALMPDDPTIPFWRSFVLVELGRNDQAVALCHQALGQANGTWKANLFQSLQVLTEQNPRFAPLAALLPPP